VLGWLDPELADDHDLVAAVVEQAEDFGGLFDANSTYSGSR
jgi:hypothetical protein